MWLIPCTVEKGMFESERSVTFDAGEKRYHLIVDRSSIVDDMLVVEVLSRAGDSSYIVRLPRETFTSGRTIRVPREVVQRR